MREMIKRGDVERYKREILEESVLVTAEVAAEVLSVSERTVYSLVRDGNINAYMRSPKKRGLRILARDLRDYVRSIKVDRDVFRE